MSSYEPGFEGPDKLSASSDSEEDISRNESALPDDERRNMDTVKPSSGTRLKRIREARADLE